MRKFKIGLTEFPWESMRSPEEIRKDADRERHLEGFCDGLPYCWLCQEEKDWAETDENEINRLAKSKLDALAEFFKAQNK